MNLHEIPREITLPDVPWEVVADMEGVYVGYAGRFKDWKYNPNTGKLYYLDAIDRLWHDLHPTSVQMGSFHFYLSGRNGHPTVAYVREHISETLAHFNFEVDPNFNPSQ